MAKHRVHDDDDDEEDDDFEQETVLFQGSLSGEEANLKANAKLVRAGLVPAKQLVSSALERRAESILLEPKGQHALVRFVIDGVAYPGARFPRQRGLAITQMIKLLAGLDIQQRKKPQTGGIKAEMLEVPYELHVESIPVGEGAERLMIRAKNLQNDYETPDGANLPKDLRTRIREITMEKKGAILVCGPPKSGTTSTAYAVLRTIDAYMLTINSIADMGGRDVVHVGSFELRPDEPYDELLTRLGRVETDVIFLDPITNAEAARKAFEAQARFSVLAEFTAKDAAHGIVQICQWMGDNAAVAEGLRAVISQKLIRQLCEACRAAFRPNPKLLARLGLPPETKTLYRAVTETARRRPVDDEDDEEDEWEPCAKCNGLGYLGRTAMFEFIEINDAMKELITESPNPSKIKALARQEKMQTLQKAGLEMVAEGKTSLEELQRVFKSG